MTCFIVKATFHRIGFMCLWETPTVKTGPGKNLAIQFNYVYCTQRYKEIWDYCISLYLLIHFFIFWGSITNISAFLNGLTSESLRFWLRCWDILHMSITAFTDLFIPTLQIWNKIYFFIPLIPPRPWCLKSFKKEE